MTTARARTVLFLHGLYAASTDPFAHVHPLEQAVQDAGFTAARFDWPAGYNGPLALAHRRRRFADELARALDSKLRDEFHDDLADASWAIVGHSGGGLTIYQWLTDYASAFGQAGGTPPGLVISLAAPYQCELQQITLPDGTIWPVHEDALTPRSIVQSLPEHTKLLICVAERDEMLAPTDVAFPREELIPGTVFQHLIEGASHPNICAHERTKQLVLAHLANL